MTLGDLPLELLNGLRYLLPGLLAAWIFYSLTPYKISSSQFERVVQALIFTLIVQIVVDNVRVVASTLASFYSFGAWTEDVNRTWSAFLALFIGLIAAYLANSDRLHAAARWFGVTRETSFASDWYGAFSRSAGYAVLHFKDGRRICGWPTNWPSRPGEGHFILEDAAWLDAKNQVFELTGVQSILIPADAIAMVEFMKEKTQEFGAKNAGGS